MKLSNWLKATPRRERLAAAILLSLAALAVAAGLYASPLRVGEDWLTFRDAGQRVLSGTPLYATLTASGAWYSNAPWVAVLLAPLAVLPERVGWALMGTLTLAICGALGRRYRFSPWKLALLIASPPVAYAILHGQIEVLVLAFLLLPAAWWPLAALTKPQLGLGLFFPLVNWRKVLLPVGAVLVVSLLLFGPWLLELIRQSKEYIGGTWNFWLHLWPYNLVPGVILLGLGVQRRDERYLLAGSPFMLPYATTGNMAGLWLALAGLLPDWLLAAAWAAWWLAAVLRGLGG